MWEKAKIFQNLKIQSQSESKVWAQMEARTKNMSDINLVKHTNLQFSSPNTGCLDKIQQFWPIRPLDTFMALPERRDHKIDQVEIALMGSPE